MPPAVNDADPAPARSEPPAPATRRARSDPLLLVGLAVAAIVAILPPFPRLFALVHEIELSWGLALFPALVVLLLVLVAHVQRHRVEARAQAVALALEADDAQRRARDLELLVEFGRSVSESLDLYALRRAIEAYLPRLANGHDVWVLLRVGERWESLSYVHPSSTPVDVREQERLATEALAMLHGRPGVTPITVGGHVCFPLSAGDRQIGVLGLAALPGHEQDGVERLMHAAATLVAVGARNVEQVREIRDHGLRDALTGCYNRAQALEVLGIELRRAERSGLPLSVIMFDLDNFKRVNDRYGHLAGDAVLATVGQLMRRELRGSDLKCRYGGEEFLVLLPETGQEAARKVAESLREALARAVVTFGERAIQVTASLGVATAVRGELSAEGPVGRADAALYEAKGAGRDCVRVASAAGVSVASGSPRQRTAPQWRPPARWTEHETAQNPTT
jgi:diguanylate cyclase (GGDEF)-like protein